MSSASRAALTAGIQAVHAEGQGAIKVTVIMPGDGPELVAAALAGDAECFNLVMAIDQADQAMKKAPRRLPAMCATCDTPIRGTGHSFAVVTGAVPRPTLAMALAVCPKCGPSIEAVLAKAQTALTKLWPDLRAATLAPGGRA